MGLSVALLSGCGGEETQGAGDNVFAARGVSFTYPATWRRVDSERLSAESGNAIWTEMFAPASSSGEDIVYVTEYRTPRTITKKTLKANAKSITDTARTLARQAGGRLLEGPSYVSMGGLPGYDFEVSASTIQDRPIRSRLLLVWNGKTEYALGCQYLDRGELAAEVSRGCRMIVSSFELT